MLKSTVIVWLLAVTPAAAQSGWFQPSLLERPDVRTALQSVDNRTAGIVDEWIKLTEMPAPTGQEQARAAYIRAEMQQLGLSDIKTDDISNVSGVRKGTGGGRDGRLCRAHGHGLSQGHRPARQARGRHPARARHRRRHRESHGDARDVPRAEARRRQTRGDLIFLASVQEEAGCWAPSTGSKRAATNRTCSSPSISRRTRLVRRPALTQYKFFYTSPGAHTMESRGGPSPAGRSPRRSRRSTAFRCRPSPLASTPSSCR